MYVKVKNGVVEQYPYSIGQLRADNPDTSFPLNMTEQTLASWDVYPVIVAEKPQVDYTKTVIEETPNLVNGAWYQDYKVVEATTPEIEQRKAELNAVAEQNRANAYRNESDPLFFKWQRGEALQQEWLDKVAEIKLRYPKV
jgi:hypothetical protein